MSSRGIALIPGVLDAISIAALRAELEPLADAAAHSRGGYRHLFAKSDGIVQLVRGRAFRSLVEPILGPPSFAVRAILFDKTETANWKVIWHQDLTIAVAARGDVPGFGPWSEKEGVPHVQPPIAILEQMLAVRLHLDDCGPLDGPLRVIPGSHLDGRLSADQIGTGFVRVRGAREHNLKNVELRIPREALVVFTGISGSGKSSLAFGTLYAEAPRLRVLRWAG